MYDYQGLFEGALFNRSAVVEIGKKVIEKTTGKYMVGKDPEPMHGLDYVHKLSISHKNDVVFEKCCNDSN
ncbi:hypothetical protein [Pseudoalteromonas byunsanensis]|uniref:Uncharacterized protein n=1 Tax=Pseudoalteromonas byunsanensis TaxID=327939 RepID=A0A1S1N4K3_9GAMM|nr:hypothetical protein [Pseudoalteromonas byunsanensis]OHU94365.1 hypothetical protein BIW53_14900 [Pseudoalteromonas byunsanensis]